MQMPPWRNSANSSRVNGSWISTLSERRDAAVFVFARSLGDWWAEVALGGPCFTCRWLAGAGYIGKVAEQWPPLEGLGESLQREIQKALQSVSREDY